ncbi:STE3-domain-containing protein [Ceratobasidium sp. AG-I]|nr:STE3-domain-containing protein [Ceratobasidium sp. AG-I]
MHEPGFPVLCALAIIAVLLPLPWHWKARNTGTLLYIGWTLVGNIVFMVNSLVWAGNLKNPAPIWCDISTKLIMAMSVGITAASLCINRRLYNIATIKSVTHMRGSKRRDAIIDLSLGVGLPILIMILHYVVQGHRFDIIEDVGCWPSVYNTLLAVPMILMWPVLISVASFIYAGLSIRAFLETRRQFTQVLSNSNSGLNMSRYFRLMALAATEMLFSLPFSLWILVTNMTGILNPWVSWEDTHQNFGHINFIPRVYIEALPHVKLVMDINRWITPAGGFLFFAYFGLAGEASAEYRRALWRLVAPFGIKPPAPKPQSSAWYVSFNSPIRFWFPNCRDFVAGPTDLCLVNLRLAATSSPSPARAPHSTQQCPQARPPSTTSPQDSRLRSNMTRSRNMTSSRKSPDDLFCAVHPMPS